MKKKSWPILLTILFAVSCFPWVAYAASGTIDTDGTYDIGAFGNDSILTIDSLASAAGLTVTLTNTSGATYTNLRIDCIDAGTKLTINGVLIDNSALSGACALAFSSAGNTLTLAGGSSLTSGYGEPGVRVEDGSALTISGSGTLSANGGSYGAGIGAGRQSNGGSITMESGTITSNGGYAGAGIGGGSGEITGFSGDTITTDGGGGGVITIKGGTVAANGGIEGAGIGGGGMGSGGTITIEGGSVTAIGIGGAGIGGGACPAYVSGTNILIAGNGSGGVITIAGGVVAANSSKNGSVLGSGAGIGGGFSGEGGVITITGGVVTASSDPTGNEYYGSAGIGGGAWNDGGVITISGGDITANGSAGGAGIGGGNKFILSGYTLGADSGEGGEITIEDGRVVATGGEYGAGIGGGGDSNGTAGGSGGTIIISGGITYAQGDVSHSAFDIGSGSAGTDGALTISGTASVFLRYDNCLPPTLPVPHSHKTTTDAYEPMEVVFGTIYGLPGTGVSPWTSATGGYFLLNRIVYSANGGEGTVTNSAIVPGMIATVKQDIGFQNIGFRFTFWNTDPYGKGTTYYPYSTLTLASPSMTLYAQWELLPPTGDPMAASPFVFLSLALLALAGIAIVVYKKAKRKAH